MDPERAPYEVARVLRPGGTFGLLWNGRDRDEPWVADLNAIMQEATRDADQQDGAEPPRERGPWHDRVRLPADAPFHHIENEIVRWSQPIAPDDLVGLIGTYSRVITLPDEQRQALLDRVAEFAHTHPALAGRDVVDLPMACRCWRSRRD